MSKQNEINYPDYSEEYIYFLDLVVENVRCFEGKQLLDLSNGKDSPSRWTVILGDNGTGKTTLLKCIALLSPENDEITYPDGGYNDGIAPLGSIIKLNYNISLSDGFFDEKHEESYIGNNNIYVGDFDSKYSEVSYGFYGIAYKNKKIYFHSREFFQKDNMFVAAYGASRKMGTGSLTESRNPFSMATLFDENASLINAEAWLLEMDFAIKNAQGTTKEYLSIRVKKVKETLLKLLPDISDFRIREITKTQTQAAMEAKTPYGWVAMKNLSLGYQSFIAWVVDLAARLFERYPDSENPLIEPCVVLVDEIDLHLHPKWQRQVIDFLTKIFENTQFIVTAHSPLIVQAAENANIVLLKRENNSVKIYNNKDEDIIKGWRVDQILTSDLFGLESTRPPKYDKYLKRKQEILEKDTISEKDEEELEEISKYLEEMPLGNEVNNDALEALKKATEILKAQ